MLRASKLNGPRDDFQKYDMDSAILAGFSLGTAFSSFVLDWEEKGMLKFYLLCHAALLKTFVYTYGHVFADLHFMRVVNQYRLQILKIHFTKKINIYTPFKQLVTCRLFCWSH